MLKPTVFSDEKLFGDEKLGWQILRFLRFSVFASHMSNQMQEIEYLTVTQVAAILNVSTDTVIRRFGNESGVIDLGSPETQRKRRYRLLRIPRYVLNRVLNHRKVA